jgi:predicted metal-dependent peptidase
VLLVSQPFYGALALQLELVEVDKDDPFITTMAVDGRHMYYNPTFTLGLKEDEIVGVVAHEVSHCSYRHFARRGNRDPELWNVAGDYIINADLKEAGFTLPGKPSHLSKSMGEKIHLFDPKYKGMSTEEVYARLLQEEKQQQKKGAGKPGQGDGKEQGPSGGRGVRDIGGCGAVIDPNGPHDKAKQDQLESEWEANVRMAVAVATAAAGKLPGHLERLVKELKKPKVSWRDYTRRFVDNSMIKDFSWARPNRRSMSSGVLLPGYISDRIHHLVGVVDTSGSVSREMQVQMVSELGGALDEGVADHLTVIYADDGVQHVDEFDQGDLVQVTATSGGGTDFTKSFEWIRENAPDASCVIYLTDMCTSGWGEEPSCPVLWAAFLPDSLYDQISKTAPFGEVIHIPRT